MDLTSWNKAWASNEKQHSKALYYTHMPQKPSKKSPKLFIIKKPIRPPQTNTVKFIPPLFFTKSSYHEALIKKVNPDLFKIWNSARSSATGSRAIIRWKNKQGTLKDNKDMTDDYLHLRYGDYGYHWKSGQKTLISFLNAP